MARSPSHFGSKLTPSQDAVQSAPARYSQFPSSVTVSADAGTAAENETKTPKAKAARRARTFTVPPVRAGSARSHVGWTKRRAPYSRPKLAWGNGDLGYV